MTSELTCPNCGYEARFFEIYASGHAWWKCSLCGQPTDDAELAAAQPSEEFRVTAYCPDTVGGIPGAAGPPTIKSETCAEAMARIERERPCARLEVSADRCHESGDITGWVKAFVAISFTFADRVQIQRFEVRA